MSGSTSARLREDDHDSSGSADLSGPATDGAVAGTMRAAARSEPFGWAARLGLASRGIVYLLLGLLALLVASGGRASVDQKGALSAVLARPLGGAVVGLLALGFACYALWRLSEAVLGVHGTDRRAGPRVQSAGRAAAYAVLTVTAVSLLLGSRQPQSTQQRGLVARLLEQPWGPAVVVLAGLGLVGVGGFMVYEGLRLRFLRHLGGMDPSTQRMVKELGRVGTTARGAVFVLTGVLVALAGWTHDAAAAGGIDAAVKTLRDAPYGVVLLTLAALGLAAFGLYGLAEARYRRV